MNNLRNILKFISYRSISTFHPSSAHWNKDWYPGDYPKTEEERKAAAEKYNLHPNEYKPYDDDGFGCGDYPKLPLKGLVLRDPYYPYDYPEHKRNFNEPMHRYEHILAEDVCDIGVKEPYSQKTIILTFIGVFGTMFGLYYITKDIEIFPPIAEKQYPWKGKSYYTFEKLN